MKFTEEELLASEALTKAYGKGASHAGYDWGRLPPNPRNPDDPEHRAYRQGFDDYRFSKKGFRRVLLKSGYFTGARS